MKKLLALFLILVVAVLPLCACVNTNTAKEPVDIPQRIFINSDGYELYTRLYSLHVSDADNTVKAEEAQRIADLMKGWECFGENVGGAKYDGRIYTSGDYTVTTDDELMAAVKSAKAGEVIFIPSGVTIDMSDLKHTENFSIRLADGVTLASDRGINEGGVIKFSHQTGTMIVCGDNTTVTGLNLSGVVALPGESSLHRGDNGIRIDGTGITVSNCEIASFSQSGIIVFPSAVANITDCFFHHCEKALTIDESETNVERCAFFKNTENGIEESDSNPFLKDAPVEESLVEQVTPDITSALFPEDSYYAYGLLNEVAEGKTEKTVDALTAFAGTTNYYYYGELIHTQKDGKDYGARDDGTGIGGGKGYPDVITEGDITVTTTSELKKALENAVSGQTVFIPSDAKISVTGIALTVKAGVTLASDRGRIKEDGTVSTGGIVYTSSRQREALILEEGARITGLVLAGADTEKHLSHLQRGLNDAGTAYTDYYYSLPLARGIIIRGDNATVSNCEISGFSEAGILIEGKKNAVVNNCYIHHNQRNGFGYGVVLYGKAEATVYNCLFNYDRHSIAADGSAESGYIAHDNIHMGTAIYHIFDAHGGGDRGDGTVIACDYVEMFNNTFLSEQLPYKRRGTPTKHSLFKNNVVLYPEEEYAYRYLYGPNFVCEDNIFGIAKKETPVYDFENGEVFLVDVSRVNVFKDTEYIDSATHNLRYAYILVFEKKSDGSYFICEYGNNLDDGTIIGVNERVHIPEGGFAITFTASDNPYRLYSAISNRHETIYNTTLMLDGDYIATLEGDLLRVVQGKTAKD